MPRTYSSIDKIRAELAWVNETPDPKECGSRCSSYWYLCSANSAGPVADFLLNISEIRRAFAIPRGQVMIAGMT